MSPDAGTGHDAGASHETGTDHEAGHEQGLACQGPAQPGADHADFNATSVASDSAPDGAEVLAGAAWLDRIRWDEQGLVPAIAQDAASHRVLMMAWMNREALAETVRTGHVVYWSRSRRRLWRKGEESGNRQRIHEIRTDCDADVILLFIDQVGGVACHTGRESCFFRRLEGGVLKPAAVAADDVMSGAVMPGVVTPDAVTVTPGSGASSSDPGDTGQVKAQAMTGPVWRDVDPVRVDPEKLYGPSSGHG